MSDSEYVEGDVNTIEGGDAEYDDDVELDDDIDSDSDIDDDSDIEDEDEDEDAGNSAAGSLPEKVLTYLARSLARDPEAVVVEAEERGGKVRLQLHVGPGDMGRVIGRRGRTAQAIRALVGVAGARSGVSTNVDIVDD